MRLTNAQRGDLIDALKIASDALHQWADGVTIGLDPDTAENPDDVRDWLGQARRLRLLRRAYLAEERASLREFFGEEKR